MRNLESSSNLRATGFIDTSTSTMVMQEYQVPVKRFEIFVFNMRDIFKRHHVDISKVIISYLAQDHGGLMTAGAEHSFSFKIIYLQKKNKDSQKKMEQWTKELIDAAVSSNGSFILPYYIPGTNEQFERAYPGSDFFFALKLKADPDGRFNNLFWRQHLAGYREKQLKMNHLKTAMEKE
jgi:FAD/FMN-containing dehydrogenase